MKKLLPKLLCLPILPALSLTTMSFVLCSCNKSVVTASDIVYDSQNYNFVFDVGNKITFIFTYTGNKNITKIDTVDIENSKGEFFVVENRQQLILNENNQFSVTVSLKKQIIESHSTALSFIFTYTDDDQTEYYEVLHNDQMIINCEYHSISLVKNNFCVDITGEQEIEYQYQINGETFPEEISWIALKQPTSIGRLSLIQNKNIPVNPETHEFSIKVKLIHPLSDKLEKTQFNIECKYYINGQKVEIEGQTTDFVKCTRKLTIAKESTTQLFSENCSLPIYLNFDTSALGEIKNITSLRVEVVDREKVMQGNVRLKNDTDIHVNSHGDFLVELIYDAAELDSPAFQVDIMIYATFDIGNMHFENITLAEEKPIYLIHEPHYDGTKVFVWPMEEGNFTLQCLDVLGNVVEGQSRNVFYKRTSDGIPYPCVIGESIHYGMFDSFEIWCADDQWSTNDYHLTLSFSGDVTIQGDVTSLLDGQGGNITELYDRDEPRKYMYAFESLFASEYVKQTYPVDVVKISKDFFRVEKVSELSFQNVCRGDDKLIYGPDLNFVGAEYNSIFLDQCFENCKSLVVGPGTLPTKQDGGPPSDYRYNQMFMNCENLLVAPVICADKRISAQGMFTNCTKLGNIVLENYVDEFTNPGAFEYWVVNVSEYGEMYYKGHNPVYGDFGIPFGWDVIHEW